MKENIKSRFDLSGRVALITGGGRGLGKEMAFGLAQSGADLFLVARTEEELKKTAKEIQEQTSRRVEYLTADLTKNESINLAASRALDIYGCVDILINNAGTNIPEELEKIQEENFETVYDIHVTASRMFAKALVPKMKERRWGRIINISSIMAFTPLPARSAYASSKAGLVALAKVWAVELGSYGITANAIAPGPFLTDLPARVTTTEQKRFFSDHTTLGRWGDPEEIAGPVLLLASDAGSYISGECLMVDGGYSAK